MVESTSAAGLTTVALFFTREHIVSLTELEKRLTMLEKQVAALLTGKNGTVQSKDWRSTLGMFTGDEIAKQVFAEGRKVREADRQRTRRTSRSRAKS